MRDVLSRLAFQLIETGDASATWDQALAISYNERLLWAMLSAQVLCNTERRVGFCHALIRDNVAAERLMRVDLNTSLSVPRFDAQGQRLITRWDPAILSMINRADPVDPVLRAVVEVDPFLALQGIGQTRSASERTQAHIVESLLGYVAHEAPASAAYAARLLRQIYGERALWVLLDVMRGDQWALRRAGGLVLSHLGERHNVAARDLWERWDGRVDEALRDAIHHAGPHILPVLLDTLREAADPQLRRGAAWALGILADRAALADLVIVAEGDADPLVRQEALAALGRIPDTARNQAFFAAITDGDENARRTAAEGLAAAGDSAVPGLLRLLAHEDPAMRRMAAGILGRSGHQDLAPALLPALEDGDVNVRATAARSLGLLRNPATESALRARLMDDEQPRWTSKTVAQLAQEALSKIEAGRVQAAAARPQTTPIARDQELSMSNSAATAKKRLKSALVQTPSGQQSLETAVASPDPAIRLRALQQLRDAHGNPQRLTLLIGLLRDPQSRIRAEVVRILTGETDPAVTRALLNSLFDREITIARAAARALIHPQRGEYALRGLAAATRSQNAQVRALAVQALGFIGDQRAVPYLRARIDDGDVPASGGESVGALALIALEEIGSPDAMAVIDAHAAAARGAPVGIPPAPVVEPPTPDHRLIEIFDLMDQLRSEDWQKRRAAAKSLRAFARSMRGESTDARVLAQLEMALRDEDDFVRWTAVESLAWMRNPAAVDLLVSVLDDENWSVRTTALRGLASLADPAALQAIILVLADRNTVVRQVAVEVLRHFQEPPAVDALLTALNDRDEFVRRTAIESLGLIGHAAAVPYLLQALHSPYPMIRWAAVQALGEIGDARAVTGLVPLLQDIYQPEWEIETEERTRLCDVTADVLTTLGTPEALRAVRKWRGEATP
jgi:HEAT repeat protein